MRNEVLKLKSNNMEKVKEKIQEQDKLKLEFKQKLNNIKVKYGIEFDIEILNTNDIDKIKFYNLKYKNLSRDMSLIYYNEHNYYGAYIYTVNKDSSMEKENYITKKNYLNKKYKLDLIIQEIKQAHEVYKSKLLELENNYKEESLNGLKLEKKSTSSNN